MSLFKKFTDFCAGVAAFIGGLFLIQKYMSFKPKELEEYTAWLAENPHASEKYSEPLTEAPGKISQFLDPELMNIDYRPIIILVAVLLVSVLVNCILRKYPFVCFLVSVLPLMTVTYMYCQKLIDPPDNFFVMPGLFIVLSALPLMGNLIECILRDREDGRHRLWLASKFIMIVPILTCIVIGTFHYFLPKEDLEFSLSIIRELSLNVTPHLLKIVIVAGISYFVILGITLPLYNVYFIDLILSTVPLGYLLYQLYDAEFSVFTAVLTLLAVICFVTNLLLCIFENNLSRKEQLQLKEQASK